MAITVQFSVLPDEARRLGLDYYDFWVLGGWGDATNGNTNTIYPFDSDIVSLPSPAGVAIHPQSDIDRVFVQTVVGQAIPAGSIPGQPVVIPAPGFGGPRTFEVTTDAPFIVSPASVATSPGDRKTLSIFTAPDQLWSQNYLRNGDPTPQTLYGGPIVGTNTLPRLGLRFFLRPQLAGPQGRAPYIWPPGNTMGSGSNNQPKQDLTGLATETLINVFPVHGRKSVTLGFRPDGTAVATIRVAMLDMSNNIVANPNLMSIERTIATIAGIAANNVKWVSFAPGGGDFCLVYATLTAGAGKLAYSCRATDTPASAVVTG